MSLDCIAQVFGSGKMMPNAMRNELSLVVVSQFSEVPVAIPPLRALHFFRFTGLLVEC